MQRRKGFPEAHPEVDVSNHPLFGNLSTRILQDESRHLAFAEHYLRKNVALMAPARRQALVEMRDDLFRILRAMTERVRADAAAFEVDADEYLAWVWTDVEAFGKRIGLHDGDGHDGPASAVEASPEFQPAEIVRPVEEGTEAIVARCFGCLLSLLCGRRLAPA